MKFRVEMICINDDGTEQRCDVMEMERHQVAMETLGLSLTDGKTILHGVQDFVASQQVTEDLNRRRICSSCGERYHSKATGTHTVNTVFGLVPGAEFTVGAVFVPDQRPQDVPADCCLAAGANESGAVLSGNEVGFTDSFRENERFIERSAASG
jgi:hypothetical protein